MPSSTDQSLILLWAKSASGDPERVHPLICHLLDTAAAVKELWCVALGASVRGTVSHRLGLNVDKAGALLAFWASLHDLGKASPSFQQLRDETLNELAAFFPRCRGGVLRVPHNWITARTLPDVLRREPWSVDERILIPLADALGGHHGSFPSPNEVRGLTTHHHLGGSDWACLRLELARELQRLLGPPLANRETYARLADDNPLLLFVAGLTSVGDWLASNELFFPYAGREVEPQGYLRRSSESARRAVELLGWRSDKPRRRAFFWNELFDFTEPNELQRAVVELDQTAGLTIIEAPTGSGKTEAALYLIDCYINEAGGHGCYFALPTTATSNQMHRRFDDYLSRRYGPGRHRSLLLHSLAGLDDTPGNPSAVGDDTEDTAAAREWFGPKKRGLLAPYGVGTVDQALLAVLHVRHVFVRLYGLTGKALVFDEIHAYDTYMSTLFERLLEWCSALEIPVVLLSATLPASKRRALLRAYGGVVSDDPPPSYPRISSVDRDKASVQRTFETAPQPKVRLVRVPRDSEALAEHLVQTLRGGGRVGIVCNLVRRSQEVYQALRRHLPPEAVGLLHARFPYLERQRREQLFLSRLGRNQRRTGTFVLVGTQVLEQSLDVDFDLLVSDPAPVDLILQRMGRLHRHDNYRPAAYCEPNMWLMEPRTDDQGLPLGDQWLPPYDRYIMLRSWAVMREREYIQRPADVEELIEAVYGSEDICEGSPAGALDKARAELDERREQERRQARLRIIKPPGYRGRPVALARGEQREDDPQTHPAFQALTRLGGPRITTICLHQQGDQLFLDAELSKTVRLEQPDEATALALRRCGVDLGHRGLVSLLGSITEPAGWKTNRHLRGCRPLVFNDRRADLGVWRLTLDEEIGLTIEKRP